MKISRRFTEAGKDVYSSIEWTKKSSRIVNPDGSVVFEMKDVEVPASWSQLATDIMVSKYFRKAGVPQSDANGNVVRDEKGNVVTGPERSVRQVIHRLAGCWRQWGEDHGYFVTTEDAQAFYDELAYMLLEQIAAPNSPQWFNTGLNWAYGINGPAQGHYYTDPATGETRSSEDAYTHPQPHACFIQAVGDDLVNEGGIMDLWVREARLFKYGSGTGTNFSQLRAEDESLSGGGRSSGLMSFLKIGDRAAGAIKSGGTTRRAAKMVCLDLDHPDIESFVNWKVREELKVAAMVEGMKRLDKTQRETAERLGLKLDYDFNGESYQTVSGQNSNNSVRIPNTFFKTLDENGDWELTRRTDGKVAKRLRARELWDQIGYAAWRCADPGVQFDSTINEWHTCPGSGRINASNPCSEYMFLDNTACNLASINLLKLYDARSRVFDNEAYEHAIRLWTIVLEISVLMAQYPSKEIARLSYEFRTLGLGYANLGAMLMQAGVPYDSQEGRALGGTLAAIMTGRSYATSAELAARHGPFPGFYKNREHMLRVIRNHRRAAYGVPRSRDEAGEHELGFYESLETAPVPIDADLMDGTTESPYAGIANSAELLHASRRTWDDALNLGNKHGYRNAQTTVIAPTGTIGLLMDCDTTGVEPDFALVKFKKLAGGGYFKIANQSIKPAFKSLGYTDAQIHQMLTYVMGHLSLNVPMPDETGEIPENATTFAAFLHDRGADASTLQKLDDALAGAMELGFVFNAWTLGEAAVDAMGLTGQKDLLKGLGLNRRQIDKLNELVCGTGTIEGAPHLADEHLPVFDCANKCGRKGQRFIAPTGHIRMMGAVQPFISGAISKTINLPNEANVDDIKAAYRMSWELGLKANALYRDGSKLSQPLNSTTDTESEDEEAVEAGKEEVSAAVLAVASRAAGAGSDADAAAAKAPVEKIVERIVERPMRRRLPNTRHSMTHKFNVAGHEGYLTVGLYEDGNPGELFITMAKEGSTIGGLMDSLGTAISVALQYGVPVESLVNKFSHQRFEPAGMTDNRDIPFAKSLVDYIFRWMGMEFIAGYRAANAPKRPSDTKTEAPAAPAAPARPEPKIETRPVEPKKPAPGIAPTPTPVAKSSVGGRLADDNNGNGHADTGVDRPRRVIVDDNTSGIDDPQIAESHVIKHSPLSKLSIKSSTVIAVVDRENAAAAALVSTLNEANSAMMGDAPACDVCGSITVRNGTCYKCLNCGNSMGCS
ncbi:MAG: adenosylcobalamin-dependent ribonucleoside-diphosphate reductase [Planctomycetes bacterium]|nr:adenosylcobalamin-dependent ribonucleoside-diphosphate reductase [Planctomycetota bacterium]